MALYEIYLVFNRVNGKIYIGQTRQGRHLKRWKEHVKKALMGDTSVFHRAIRKYGKENFEFCVIESNIPELEINSREEYYIKYYHSFISEGGYNMTTGGQGIHGYAFTKQDKQKISKRGRFYWEDIKRNHPQRYKELCQKRSQVLKGLPKSETAKAHLSSSKKAYFKTHSIYNKGKHISEQQKQKISDTRVERGLSFPVNKFDLKTGKLIATFNSAKMAAKDCLKNKSTAQLNQNTVEGRISLVCHYKRGHAYGFIWRYSKDFPEIIPPQDLAREHLPAKAKAVYQYDLQGNFVKAWDSAAEVSRFFESDYRKQRSLARKINDDICSFSHRPIRGFIWRRDKC